MPDHASTEPVPTEIKPVALAEGARVVLAALVALGWISLDSATINTVTTAVAVVASIALTIWTRYRVAATAKLPDQTS